MSETRVIIPWTNDRVIETIQFHGSHEPIYMTRPEVQAWLKEHVGPMKAPWDEDPHNSTDQWTWYESTRQRMRPKEWYHSRNRLESIYREFIFWDARHAILFKLTWG